MLNPNPMTPQSNTPEGKVTAEETAKRPIKSADTEALKSKFFATFGEQSFRGYSLDQCNAIWEFFAPHLTDNEK